MMPRTKIGNYSKKQLFSLPDGVYRLQKFLFFRVRGNGKYRFYFFRYTNCEGILQDVSLGSAKKVPLSEVKQQACFLQNMLMVSRGQLTDGSADVNNVTFREFSHRTIDRLATVKLWKNPEQKQSWLSSIDNYACPKIGEKLVLEVTRKDILSILEPIWTTKTMTATRLRGRLEKIFSYAISEGLYMGENPAKWKSNLEMYLPPAAKCSNATHFKALNFEELVNLVSELYERQETSAQALLFGILTATRAVEFTQMRWTEIDWSNNVWNCPAERRKDGNKECYRVPLSRQAMMLLKERYKEKSGHYVFSIDGQTPIRRETPRKFLKESMNVDATVHGMRSTFRDWCAMNEINDILAEKSLMHSTGNKVVQAYQRSDLLEERRPVMQKWGDALIKLKVEKADSCV